MVTLVAEQPRPYQRLASYIKEERRRRRMSQADLASMVGVSTGYIGHLEVGRQRPSPEVLRLIGRSLDVPYSKLAALAEYADSPTATDVTQDEMRRDFADLTRRIMEFGRKYGISFGGDATPDSKNG